MIDPTGLLGPVTCFFYGTLMDRDVLRAVAGTRVCGLTRRPAVVEGYRRPTRAGAVYPILQAYPGARVRGVVVAGLRAHDVARLNAFEGHEYGLAPVTVTVQDDTITALAYIPRPWVHAASTQWSFEAWRRRHKAQYLQRIATRTGVVLRPLRRRPEKTGNEKKTGAAWPLPTSTPEEKYTSCLLFMQI